MQILHLHIDAMRWDWETLAKNGIPNIMLPGFQILLDKFICIDSCWSTSTCTLSSVCSLMTATFPATCGVRSNDIGSIHPNIRTFPQILKEDYNYNTHGIFCTGYKHINNWKRNGIEKGFSKVEYVYDLTNVQEQQGRATQLIKRIPEFINILNNKEQDQYLYIQVLDMHGWNGRDKNGNSQEYLQGVKQVDLFLYNLLKKINFENTVVMVHGDHGWRLPEDDKKYKYCMEPIGMSLLEPLNRVGCYLSFPKSIETDIANDITCRTIDIWPTVFDVMGLGISENDLKAIEGVTLNCFEGILPGSGPNDEEPFRILYSEHVEWFVKRNPIIEEPENKQIPLLNWAIGYRDFTTVFNANNDIPTVLFRTSMYNFPVMGGVKDIIRPLVNRFNKMYNDRIEYIKYNEDHYIENSNEFVRDKLKKVLNK